MGRAFNGSSDKILATTVTAAGSWTIAGWALANGTGGTQAIVYNGNSASNGFGIQSSDGSAHIRGVIGTAGNVTSTTGAPAAWAHYALVNNAGSQTLYLNGASIGTASISPVAPSGGNLSIGVDTSNFFGGNVADVAVWNTNLTAGNITSLASGARPKDVNSANLQAWYPLGSSLVGGLEPDLSGNANNGTLTGTTITASPNQIRRGARNFNGSSDKIITALPTTSTSTLSIAGWVNLNAINGSTSQIPFYLGNATTPNGFGVYLPATLARFNALCGSLIFTGTIVVALNTWAHVCFAFVGGGTSTLYINGQSSITGTGTTSTPTIGLGIGVDGNSLFNWNGLVADVALWSVTLSSGDVANLVAGVRPNSVQGGSLIGWWPCDSNGATETDRSSGANNGTVTGTTSWLGPPYTWRIG